MRRIRRLGLTGTVQTGKSELRSLFEACGWIYHDLNDSQCILRAKGTERYELFEKNFPGAIGEDGHKRGRFYDTVTAKFYHERVQEDLKLMVPVTLKLIEEADGKPVILSWEYLPLIAHKLPLDHTLFFTSNYEVWWKRLYARLQSRGVDYANDDYIRNALDVLNVWPNKIRSDVEHCLAGRFTEIDVSPEDWGADTIRAWLQNALKSN